jgi:hypothetical protein
LLYFESNVGVKIKGTSRMKKEARHATPPAVPVKAEPTL